jgi:hypothetical protein
MNSSRMCARSDKGFLAVQARNAQTSQDRAIVCSEIFHDVCGVLEPPALGVLTTFIYVAGGLVLFAQARC